MNQLNHKTALALKEAGFKQPDNLYPLTKYKGGYIDNGLGVGTALKKGKKITDNKSVVYVPTLEELIDACGDGFHSLDRMRKFDDNETFGWATNLYNTTGGVEIYDSPLEAVAKLYIKLNT